MTTYLISTLFSRHKHKHTIHLAAVRTHTSITTHTIRIVYSIIQSTFILVGLVAQLGINKLSIYTRETKNHNLNSQMYNLLNIQIQSVRQFVLEKNWSLCVCEV